MFQKIESLQNTNRRSPDDSFNQIHLSQISPNLKFIFQHLSKQNSILASLNIKFHAFFNQLMFPYLFNAGYQFQKLIFPFLSQYNFKNYHPISFYNLCDQFIISGFKNQMQNSNQNPSSKSDDVFMNSKLFSEALSQQTSHYIQSKLLSLPKDAQDLKKLDLRHMCDTVVKQLEKVEKDAAYDYVKVSEQLETLGTQLTVADGIMQELQNVLYNFKGHLQTIKHQMTSLQQKSNKMNTSLSNKKKVQSLLNSFIDSAVLDKELIDAICLGQIDDNYVNHVKALLKKLSYLNSNLISADSKAVKELQPELQKLKGKASVRLRQFLLDQINLLKKPKTNIQIVQKNVLSKYKVFTEFFKDQNPGIFTELCNAYREIMAKIYMSNYKIYLQQIYKLQVELYTKTDQVIPSEPQNMKLFLTQIKPTNLNQDKKSIFSLMNRDKIIEQHESSDVILYNVANQKGQKFTIEQIFKSVNKALIDGVMNQVVFTAQFFNVKSEGAIDLFGPIFRPSYNIFIEHLKTTVSSSYDIFGILLILAINQKNKQNFQEKEFKALDHYFDDVSMKLWPRFEELFDFHMKSLTTQTTVNFKKMEKTVGPKAIIERVADFIVSFSRMVVYFSNPQMIEIRVETFKKSFFALITKLCSEFEREIDGLVYHLNVLEQFHHSFTIDTVVAKLKSYQESQNEMEKEINNLSMKIVSLYIKDFFPSVDSFIKKYCKDEGMTAEESTISVQGVVDKKVIEAIISDLSSNNFNNRLQKYIEFTEKTFTGYSLKTNLKKFMGLFMKYYNEIYKYIKNNHPEDVSLMLQPHNMMKEIKNSLSKFNV